MEIINCQLLTISTAFLATPAPLLVFLVFICICWIVVQCAFSVLVVMLEGGQNLWNPIKNEFRCQIRLQETLKLALCIELQYIYSQAKKRTR